MLQPAGARAPSRAEPGSARSDPTGAVGGGKDRGRTQDNEAAGPAARTISSPHKEQLRGAGGGRGSPAPNARRLAATYSTGVPESTQARDEGASSAQEAMDEDADEWMPVFRMHRLPGDRRRYGHGRKEERRSGRRCQCRSAAAAAQAAGSAERTPHGSGPASGCREPEGSAHPQLSRMSRQYLRHGHVDEDVQGWRRQRQCRPR